MAVPYFCFRFLLHHLPASNCLLQTFFPPNTVRVQQYAMHYSCGNFAFQRGEQRLLPATLVRIRTARSPLVVFLAPTAAVLLARMLSSLLLLSLTLFCTGFACECRFVIRSCTCACEIAGVISLSSFSFALPNSTFAEATSSRCPVLASHHLPHVTKGLVGTLHMGTLCYLHVFFLYVQSILLVTTFQCPFYEVKCVPVPYRGSPGKTDYNGSRLKGFMMCIDLWVWNGLSNVAQFSMLKPNLFCYTEVR